MNTHPNILPELEPKQAAEGVLARRAKALASQAASLHVASHAPLQARQNEARGREVLFVTVPGLRAEGGGPHARGGKAVIAMETRFVTSVGRLPAILPLPGTPPFILGVTIWEGSVLAVNDCALLLDGQTMDAGEMSQEDATLQHLIALHGPDPEMPALAMLLQVGQLLGVGTIDDAAWPGGEAWSAPPGAPGRFGQCRSALVAALHVSDMDVPPRIASVIDCGMLLGDPSLLVGEGADVSL